LLAVVARGIDLLVENGSPEGIDPDLLRAWLTARSVGRGLPPPSPDCGGFRVDTNSDDELVRWVFPKVNDGLAELGHRLREPRHLIKVGASSPALRAVLPERWELRAPSYFMIAGAPAPAAPLPEGYALALDRDGPVAEARVVSQSNGAIVASGFAAQAAGVFVYDRIGTVPEHRRKGFGSVIMTALRKAKTGPSTPELLVATEEGRALYVRLVWRVLSPYSTASIPEGQGHSSEQRRR
jgi:hypothetical protein